MKEELISFASIWSAPPENDEEGIMINDEWLDTVNENMEHEFCKTCNKCMSCILRFITEYNMHILQHKNLYKVYTYLLTLPLTQVSCEWAFSKLKIIKTCLNSKISQEHLESFLIMPSEKNLLTKVRAEKVLEKLCEQSKETRRLLMP